MGLRIGTVLNLPLNRLADLSAKLTPTEPVVTVCNSAYRSSMAVGVLERKGFTKASSLAGGSEAWIAAGLPTYGAEVRPDAKTAVAAVGSVRKLYAARLGRDRSARVVDGALPLQEEPADPAQRVGAARERERSQAG